MPRSRKATQGRNEFSARLSTAIAERGLTLHRLQAHLAQRGQAVSVATLSYWSNGRSVPSRATSMDVVVALEAVLQLEPGALTGALAGTPPLQMAWEQERIEQLRQTIRAANLPSADGQQLLMAHYEAVVSRERRLSASTTTLALEARQAGAQGWSITVDRAPGQRVAATAELGIRLGRTIELDAQATIFEFLFHQPLDRGAACRTRHHLDYTAAGPETPRIGYAFNRPPGLLVLTCTFEGPVPSRIGRFVTSPGPDVTSELVEEVEPAPVVECVIPSPEMGLNSLDWQW